MDGVGERLWWRVALLSNEEDWADGEDWEERTEWGLNNDQAREGYKKELRRKFQQAFSRLGGMQDRGADNRMKRMSSSFSDFRN